MRLLVKVSLLGMSLLQISEAACCRAHTDPDFWSTPADQWPEGRDPNLCDDLLALGAGNMCCGHGPCNLFCCACAGGCRTVQDPGDPSPTGMRILDRSPATEKCPVGGNEALDCSQRLFRVANIANTGALSLDEFLTWVDQSMLNGMASEESLNTWTSRFHSFDANGDGFITPDEIDHDV